MGIWCLNTNNTKRLLPKMRVNSMKRNKKKWPKNLVKKPKSKPKKKFLQKPGPKFFRTFSLSTRTHHYKKKLHSILFGNWYHDSKKHKDLHHHACFFSLLR